MFGYDYRVRTYTKRHLHVSHYYGVELRQSWKFEKHTGSIHYKGVIDSSLLSGYEPSLAYLMYFEPLPSQTYPSATFDASSYNYTGQPWNKVFGTLGSIYQDANPGPHYNYTLPGDFPDTEVDGDYDNYTGCMARIVYLFDWQAPGGFKFR